MTGQPFPYAATLGRTDGRPALTVTKVRACLPLQAEIVCSAPPPGSSAGEASPGLDRTATTAGLSKGLTYRCFATKKALLERVLTLVRLDGRDLPAYAGRLFDRYAESPHSARLALWQTLEREDAGQRLGHIAVSTRSNLASISAAQQAGLVSGNRGAAGGRRPCGASRRRRAPRRRVAG
ncbi:hypothetical protein ACGFJ7_15800 [Actinoplanes sp. NPDC048988]|uniref:hypothetical protein n=1 Tax=Actinoplanes sp. NPDC048988 TaxID=3363901 RepID=UPI00370F897A